MNSPVIYSSNTGSRRVGRRKRGVRSLKNCNCDPLFQKLGAKLFTGYFGIFWNYFDEKADQIQGSVMEGKGILRSTLTLPAVVYSSTQLCVATNYDIIHKHSMF